MEVNCEYELVSVIIPVYNAETFIKDAIISVENQTYKKTEIIIIDDCSTDNSAKIIKELCNTYPNIIYHLQAANYGVAVARNTGIDIAKGRYIAFLDSDDQWKKDKLQKQLGLMKQKSAGFVFTAIEMIDKDDIIKKTKRRIKTEVTYNYLLRNTVIATSSVLIDRNIVKKFHMPLMRSGQDYATWLLILRKGIVAYGLDEALTRYRIGNKSLSSNKLKSIKQVFCIQVGQEKINPIHAMYNACWFVLYALGKYLG